MIVSGDVNERLINRELSEIVTDYFDNNAYSHDPRAQFMNWALMYNAAWDYYAGMDAREPVK